MEEVSGGVCKSTCISLSRAGFGTKMNKPEPFAAFHHHKGKKLFGILDSDPVRVGLTIFLNIT